MATVGVPLTTPEALFRLKPHGSVGITLYEATAPPLLVGVLAEIASPTGYVADAAA